MPWILHNNIFLALSVSREEEVDLGRCRCKRHAESINKFLILRGAWRNAFAPSRMDKGSCEHVTAWPLPNIDSSSLHCYTAERKKVKEKK